MIGGSLSTFWDDDCRRKPTWCNEPSVVKSPTMCLEVEPGGELDDPEDKYDTELEMEVAPDDLGEVPGWPANRAAKQTRKTMR